MISGLLHLMTFLRQMSSAVAEKEMYKEKSEELGQLFMALEVQSFCSYTLFGSTVFADRYTD